MKFLFYFSQWGDVKILIWINTQSDYGLACEFLVDLNGRIPCFSPEWIRTCSPIPAYFRELWFAYLLRCYTSLRNGNNWLKVALQTASHSFEFSSGFCTCISVETSCQRGLRCTSLRSPWFILFSRLTETSRDMQNIEQSWSSKV